MPERQDDNYQYDAGTANEELSRYRLYDKGDDGWLEIIDKETGRSIQIKDGEIRSDNMNGIEIAREEDGDDIFDAVNKALASAGTDSTIFVEPGEYFRENGKAVSTQLQTTHEGQIIDFLGSDVELADGADVDPVHIIHDSVSIRNLRIVGNRANNTFNYGIHADSVKDVGLDNIEISETPIGIQLTSIRGGRIVDIGTDTYVADVDVGIRATDSENTGILESFVVGFSDHGVEIVNSEDMHVLSSAIATSPDGQAVATSGLHVVGTMQSQFDVSVESLGDVTNGVLSEPYDPGGANEALSDQNSYDIKVEGADEVGIRLSDAVDSRVTGHITGEGGDPRTTQAFLVDHPNGINDTPAHNIALDISKCTRVTDTQISSANSGMQITGHYRQISETSTIQSNGTGVFTPTFGPSTPNPVFNVLTDTSMEAKIRARRATTDTNGQVEIDWSDRFAFDDKPIVMVQLENAGSWYVDTYNTDTNGRYISATIQVTDPDGTVALSGESVLAMLNGV